MTSAVVVAGVHALPARLCTAVVRHVLLGEGRDAAVSLCFLGPRAMARLNATHMGHDRPTDVIAFALPLPDDSLTGDIYICRWYAAREARAHGVAVRDELIRLVVHATLHVLGWDHPDGAERVQSPMWARQEQYVRELVA